MPTIRVLQVALLWITNALLTAFAGDEIGKAVYGGDMEKRQSDSCEIVPRTIRMKVTAYCPCKECCALSADGKTSIGDDAYLCDGVAADPRLIPYRTILFIPGAGSKEMDDTGAALRRAAEQGIRQIDLRLPTHEEALRWGVQWLPITILSTPKT